MSQRTSPPLFSPSVGNRQRRARPWNLSLLLVVGALTLGAVIFMLPFLWMVLTSLKSDRQVRTIPLLLWPDPLLIEPYVRA